ncbi:MAG: SoxR reducing system RseC family protein [Muribaculaceae bacterium]|nr:SoxR reducing system RseC family protein [Muribaculaceae bacterium]MDE6533728.1 SoxR reducing system RseC family protein [Muribaculaceae bacterium]
MDNRDTIEYIDHKAIVVSTDPPHNIVRVRIDDSGECGNCPAATLCNAGNSTTNVLEISTRKAFLYNINDIVTVRGTERLHRKAILFGTVAPTLSMIVIMVMTYFITGNQFISAILGIADMLVFFALLWSARDKVAHEFKFSIVGPPEHAGEGK